MRTIKLFLISLVVCLWVYQIMPAYGGLSDIFKSVKKAVGSGEKAIDLSGGLSEEKIIKGLKEALRIGTGNAVKIVSKAGGYYKNPEIKIPLPGTIQKVEKLLRTVGFGDKVDAFEMSMNTAAEEAAPQAKTIFGDAIRQMTFADAKKILDGKDDAATLYFKNKTDAQLSAIFKPVVHKNMAAVGVTSKYQMLDKKLAGMPLVKTSRLDLDEYVTKGALDGLFQMLAKEEKKIRENPAGRVTALLKEVFGSKKVP